KIVMAFDSDPSKSEGNVGGVPIYHIAVLEDRIGDVIVAILTIPASEADGITTRLLACGIEGILNFIPARISVPEHIRVHHIDLAVELQAFDYFLKHYQLDEGL